MLSLKDVKFDCHATLSGRFLVTAFYIDGKRQSSAIRCRSFHI